ncbi:hypothetical protein [Breznakia pachnodae]|uniref:Uncharacterized protein n=1 Tax=Breznakia pachnodae TaxID=265178 RepID=A0ABU0DZY4_9FIRM|nr:hypothetical protein [Breznakia pachnodae]MDQ0360192.1 hypothetical protein [Breznakia pachnodae]
MIKRCIRILLIIVSIISVQSFNKVEAASTSFSLSYTSQAHWVETGKELSLQRTLGSGVVPYGSTIRIDYQIKNESGNVDAKVQVQKKEGLEYFSYYSGVLKINGKICSESEYYSFIDGGNSLRLSDKNIEISIEMKSIGSYSNKVSTDLTIQSSSVNRGPDMYVTEHAFYSQFSFQNNYMINFYDGDSLIETMKVKDQEQFKIPTVSKEHYTFLGFNEKKDGTGNYLTSNIAVSSKDYYAIYEVDKYTVRYFDEDELVGTEIVTYGSNANGWPSIESKDGFLKWDKDLSEITRDTDVYAIFKDSEIKSKYSISINEQKLNIEEKEVIKKSNYDVLYGDKGKSTSANEYEVRTITIDKEIKENMLPVGLILLGLFFMVIAIKKIRNSKLF